jgi:translation initiation factor eIF-2B subunit delta
MGGKKKGKGPQVPSQTTTPAGDSVKQPESSAPPKQPTDNETYDRFQKLEQITQQLKALSPKKKEETTKETQPNMDGKPRESVMEERQRKKAEKAALKAQKAAEKSNKPIATNPSQSQPSAPTPQIHQSPSQLSAPKSKSNGNEESPKPNLKVATQNLPEPKSVLKQISPTELQKEKSNLKVRFDLQPGNNNPASHSLYRPKSKFILATSENVHPSFRRLAAKCEANKLPGFNELLYEFYGTLIEFVTVYNGEPDITYKAALKTAIQPQLNCLSDNSARPFPLAIGNLIRQFRKKLNTLDENMGINESKESVIEWVRQKREENFELAEKAIVECTIQKLRSQSHRNILTYSRCPIVEQIILKACEENLDLHVFVVDSPIGHHGKDLLDTCSEQNIACTYGELSSIGYLIEQVSLVLLGCSGILSNGRVVAPRGSSLLALCAHAKNIPVLIAAKTCTFVDKVRLDEHLSTALLSEPIETIPEDLVTALVTDLRILPPSSAPAVLKAKQLANED